MMHHPFRYLRLLERISVSGLSAAEKFVLRVQVAVADGLAASGKRDAAAELLLEVRNQLPAPAKRKRIIVPPPGEPVAVDVQAAVDRACLRILERMHPGTRWQAVRP